MSKQRDHTPSWKIVGQGERPTKRVGIYARVDDAQGLELSGSPNRLSWLPSAYSGT